MGGFNSGRHGKRGASTTVDQLSIDVLNLYRRSCLRVGVAGTWKWTRAAKDGEGTEVYASVQINAWGPDATPERASVFGISYTVQGQPYQTQQQIPIEWTPCKMGGARPWFRCPTGQNGCGRRCGVLYIGPGGFRCRVCLGLVYRSQVMGDYERIQESQRHLHVHQYRPKGMHERTYLLLRARLEAEETERQARVAVYLAETTQTAQRLQTRIEGSVRRAKKLTSRLKALQAA